MHVPIRARRWLPYVVAGTVLLLLVLLIPQMVAHAQTKRTINLLCRQNACDLADPSGRCDQPSVFLGCASADYPKGGTYAPAPGSCEAAGERLAVNHPIDRPAVLKNLTTDGTAKGTWIALLRLMYSDSCGTNWIDVILQGPCAAKQGRGSPCNVTGSLQRTSRDTRDGDATIAGFFRVAPDGHTHTTMLYAPDVPVQGCVSVVYPNRGASSLASPTLCLTQAGF